ncbi:hypothetical protein KY290_010623 [Solanum tuberosum]|uniref:3'-5' exonuclease domain-containing protein n=1 Tax=Solanum tuberosum TaxID=4113 RepID=A0ABQ7VYA8_SOLTU|nr:hypothetical protein KY290_010623 [Solanum tuberosum]
MQDHHYRNYDVYFYGDSILIIVTLDPEIVTHWITDVEFDSDSTIPRYLPGIVGVEIKADVEKLERDHGLIVSYSVDLKELAATAYEAFGLVYQIRKNVGLKELCSVVLLKEMVKPAHITRSRWDYRFLNEEQVEYACIDAFVCFEIEKRLNASGYGCNWL